MGEEFVKDFDEMDRVTVLISKLGDLSDEEFVSFVRKTRTENLFSWNYQFWIEAVDREIKMRLLLKTTKEVNL